MNMTLVAETTHKASETNFVGAINKLRDANCDVVMLGTIIKDTIIAVSPHEKWDGMLIWWARPPPAIMSFH